MNSNDYFCYSALQPNPKFHGDTNLHKSPAPFLFHVKQENNFGIDKRMCKSAKSIHLGFLIHKMLLAWKGSLCLNDCLDGFNGSKNIHANATSRSQESVL